MLKNYFKIAYRNLFRNKAFSLINISGLVIGMTSAMLILLWIQNEISYDRFHANINRLYEVWGNNNVNGAIMSGVNTPEIMGPVIKQNYPEVEEVARVGWGQQLLFSYNDKILRAKGNWSDPSFLTMFNFPLEKGDSRSALDDPHSIILTRQLAKSLFGEDEPMGKIIKIDNAENYVVTGIFKDLPANTQFYFQFMYSSEFRRKKGYLDANWADVSIRTFVLLKPNIPVESVNSKINDIIIKNSEGRSKTTSFLYPVSQLYLYSDFDNGKPAGGRISTVRIFAIIAAFILAIACINFMNLSTARSEKRAKEVGIRKMAGATRGSLIGQYLGESVLIACIAGLLALIFVQLSLPSFDQLVGQQLSIEYGNIYFWLSGIFFILITGILAGSYPAFFLAAFKPASVLKGTFKNSHALITPRKVLVVLQFSFAIILIICTIIVGRQVDFGQTRKTGYDKKNLIYINMEGDISKNYESIRDELINTGAATAVSQSLSPLTQSWSSVVNLSWQGKSQDQSVVFNRSATDGGIVQTAGFHLLEGRDIDIRTYPTDSSACIINESAARVMGFNNPIGQTIYDNPASWHIVGVIKDFILESPYQPIKPMIIKGPKSDRAVLNIKLNDNGQTAAHLSAMERIMKKYNPGVPLEYYFVDQEYASKFNGEKQTGKLATLFAVLTIFISCLGLFGLATYMAETRIKEIGIRKVLGASIIGIVTLLSKDFVKLVFISILIASPISYLAMRQWLQNFDYRTAISWWIFLLAGLLAILIAILTVSYQSIKAGFANPVKNLRSE